MSLTDRFEKLESSVKSITEIQSEYKPLMPLLSDVDSLLKAEQLVAAYRKKLTDLTQACEEGKNRTQALGVKVRTMVGSADQTLSELITKRQKDVRHLESKASNVENLYQQILHEGQIAAKQLQVALKQEAIEVATVFDRKLAEDKANLLQKLEKMKGVQSEAVVNAREEAKRALQELGDFGKNNEERIGELKSSTPASQGSRVGTEEAKGAILGEVTARLSRGMQNMKEHMEEKCKAIGWHYSGEMLRLRGEVESAREGFMMMRPEKPAVSHPVDRLKSLNNDILLRLAHLNAYCTRGLLNISDLCKAAQHVLDLSQTEGVTDFTRPQLVECRKQVEYSLKQAADIANKAKVDWEAVQMMLQEAKTVSAGKGVKLTAEKKAQLDTHRDLRLRLEKEVLPT